MSHINVYRTHTYTPNPNHLSASTTTSLYSVSENGREEWRTKKLRFKKTNETDDEDKKKKRKNPRKNNRPFMKMKISLHCTILGGVRFDWLWMNGKVGSIIQIIGVRIVAAGEEQKSSDFSNSLFVHSLTWPSSQSGRICINIVVCLKFWQPL